MDGGDQREWAGQGRQPTAMDVARLAGVSQSAVSRTFTVGASVSGKTRDKVMKAAEAIGYRPNYIARSLTMRQSRVIGVAIGYLDNQFYPAMLERLSERLALDGYRLLLFTAGHSGFDEPLVEEVLRYRVDALLLLSASLSSELARQCRRAGVPVVLVNRKTGEPGAVAVTGDNIGGARAIATYLLALGHQRFGYVAGIAGSSTSRDREEGFREVLAGRGIVPVVVAGNYDFEGAKAATRQLLSAADAPDALFFANDHMAIAGIEVARYEFGLRIGQDISIVGFDDAGPASWSSYDLTTWTQPIGPMVEEVVRLTHQLLAGPADSGIESVVPGKLVVRSSTRRPTT